MYSCQKIKRMSQSDTLYCLRHVGEAVPTMASLDAHTFVIFFRSRKVQTHPTRGKAQPGLCAELSCLVV